ncbi:MAG: triple tyrosine motif-containing protein [Pseudomonadota bacterium]
MEPAELEFNLEGPAVVLTSVSVLNAPMDTEHPYERIERIDLGYRDDVVTFSIAALDFAAPENNRYEYRLDGFDSDWVDAGTERRITYTNLDGGDYRLRVRASNGDGVWNDMGSRSR